MDHCHGSLLCWSRGVRGSKIRGRQIRIATRVSPAEDRSSAPVLAVRHRDYSWNNTPGAETRGIARLEVDSHLAGEKSTARPNVGLDPDDGIQLHWPFNPVSHKIILPDARVAPTYFLRNIKWGKQRKQVTCDARDRSHAKTETHRIQVRPEGLTASELAIDNNNGSSGHHQYKRTISTQCGVHDRLQGSERPNLALTARGNWNQPGTRPRGSLADHCEEASRQDYFFAEGKSWAMLWNSFILSSRTTFIRQVRRNGVTYAYALLQDFGVRCTKGEVL